MIDRIHYGSRNIEFILEYSNRKTLGIIVKPNLEILVKAPVDSDIEKIREKLRKRAAWIIRQQSYFLSFMPKTPQRRYISGETHLYMGKQYRLKVITDKALFEIENVKLKGQFICVFANNKKNAENLLNLWYLEKAKEKFNQIAEPLFRKLTSKHKLKDYTYQLSILYMPTRWGSCTAKGKVILNPELIKAPKGCIEYVITHELCHLIHRNHTQKFLALQSKEMPDWERWKTKLERLLA